MLDPAYPFGLLSVVFLTASPWQHRTENARDMQREKRPQKKIGGRRKRKTASDGRKPKIVLCNATVK
jgi:hypothetical protein